MQGQLRLGSPLERSQLPLAFPNRGRTGSAAQVVHHMQDRWQPTLCHKFRQNRLPPGVSSSHAGQRIRPSYVNGRDYGVAPGRALVRHSTGRREIKWTSAPDMSGSCNRTACPERVLYLVQPHDLQGSGPGAHDIT